MPAILIIDDLEDNTTLIKETLLSFFPDAVVDIALGGREGLRKAEESAAELDLIILDANMPDLSGFEVCERLKSNSQRPICPILMLSAVFVNSKDRIRGLESGADGYLCKPYHIEELIAQVKVLLRIKEKEDLLLSHKSSLTDQLEETANNLSQAEQRFSTIFEATPDAIYLLSDSGDFIDINPAACAMHGVPYNEIVGGNISRFVPFEQFVDFQENMTRCLEGEGLSEYETSLLGAGGQAIPVSITYKAITYEEKPALILNVRDISIRRAAEEQLRLAQKMDAVGRLAGGIAHDFNNMLTSILGYAFLIKENSGEKNEGNDVDQIITAAERATRLTRQLLVFSRKQTMPQHAVDLNGVVQDIDHLLRRTIGENIELVTVLDEDLPYVNSDEGHLEQVILNLSVNAKDAMPTGGKLVLETVRRALESETSWQGQTVPAGIYSVLRIVDDGTGMSPEVLNNVFEPFFTTKNRSSGMGMGLTTVYGIVKNSEGYIHIQSEPGRGTEVEVYFPEFHIPPEIADQMKAKDELPGGTETILLVEDEELLRRLTTRVLTSLGYTVLEARHGEEALRLLEEHPEGVDLLITDVIMPRMGGPELVEDMTASGYGEVKVLFISGFTDEAFAATPEQDKQRILLLKPYTKTTLAQKIREVIDGKTSE